MSDVDDDRLEHHRKQLYDALHAASRDYDQAILTLAAASLAPSVTFAHDITPTPVEGTRPVLFAAWVSLVVSLLSIVASFLTSQRLLRDELNALNRPDEATSPPFWATWTEPLNWLAGLALVLGLVVLGWYAAANT